MGLGVNSMEPLDSVMPLLTFRLEETDWMIMLISK